MSELIQLILTFRNKRWEVPREAFSLLHYVRTSPVESLYVEANEPSLETRRSKRGVQYATKLKAYPSNQSIRLFLTLYMFTINNPIQFNLLDSE